MNSKTSNSWQKTMYDKLSAALLDSSLSHKQAKEQVNFLIQTLGLKKGQTILDIPCGTGRHTLAFAQKGFSVVGVDINAVCVKTARKNGRNRKNIQIKREDMKKIAWARGKFDIVLNMFTSFGYFKTKKENEEILKGFFQALRPGGKVIIQTINRNWVLQKFSSCDWEEDKNLHTLSQRTYDPKTKYLEVHQAFLCKRSKMWEKSYHRIRLYSLPEMKILLKKVGFKKIKIFEDSLNRPSKVPHRPFYVAEVPK